MVIREGVVRQIIIDGNEFDPAQDSTPVFNMVGRGGEVKLSGNLKVYGASNPFTSFFSNDLSVDEDDFKKLQDLQTSRRDVVVTVTFASGRVASGTAVVSNTDALQNSNGTCTLELRGNMAYI